MPAPDVLAICQPLRVATRQLLRPRVSVIAMTGQFALGTVVRSGKLVDATAPGRRGHSTLMPRQTIRCLIDPPSIKIVGVFERNPDFPRKVNQRHPKKR